MAFTLSSSKEGYVFIGWSTTPNGDAECEDGSTFSKKKQIM
ncbi:MAG TPA: InlB B-repeat-containing protein [Gallicola sp.]|nr:InlB B-repeat-containing protein [Gallicola sp.]